MEMSDGGQDGRQVSSLILFRFPMSNGLAAAGE